MAVCQKCEKPRKHYRVKGRTAYACETCGNHIYPLAGTIFEKSSTALRIWFHAMYLMGSTRCGISAKQIQRETGVTYKTAWRMFHQIRKLMDEECSLAAKAAPASKWMRCTTADGARMNSGRILAAIGKQTTVMGIVERKGRDRGTGQPRTDHGGNRRTGERIRAAENHDLHRRSPGYRALHQSKAWATSTGASITRKKSTLRAKFTRTRLRDFGVSETRNRRRVPLGQRKIFAVLPRRVFFPVQPPLFREFDFPRDAGAGRRDGVSQARFRSVEKSCFVKIGSSELTLVGFSGRDDIL